MEGQHLCYFFINHDFIAKSETYRFTFELTANGGVAPLRLHTEAEATGQPQPDRVATWRQPTEAEAAGQPPRQGGGPMLAHKEGGLKKEKQEDLLMGISKLPEDNRRMFDERMAMRQDVTRPDYLQLYSQRGSEYAEHIKQKKQEERQWSPRTDGVIEMILGFRSVLT